MAIILGVGGLVIGFAGAAQGDTGTGIGGLGVCLLGCIIGLANTPPKHYISGIEAQEKALEYNKNLRRQLGLNLNVSF